MVDKDMLGEMIIVILVIIFYMTDPVYANGTPIPLICDVIEYIIGILR